LNNPINWIDPDGLKIIYNNSRPPTDPKLLAILEKIDAHYEGKDVIFPDPTGLGGLRTPEEQEKIRSGSGYGTGGERVSQHVLGRAADIVVPCVSPQELAEVAREFGATGTRPYYKRGFVHIDTRIDDPWHPR
jgi:uncharacterized protein YcbK (DUF882 family)